MTTNQSYLQVVATLLTQVLQALNDQTFENAAYQDLKRLDVIISQIDTKVKAAIVNFVC